VRAKRKPGSHITYSRECEKVWGSVREWTFTLPRQLPFWEMEFQWTLKTSESNFRGQNSISCGILYIIGNILECRCLKWARIVHLDIWNISYGQKKGQELNCQFDSRSQKVRNLPNLLVCRGRATYLGKLQLCFRLHLDPKSTRNVMGLQSCGSPCWCDFGTPTWESWERKVIWM
jgi:hypothetical protein